jgi:hypothetical protein
LFLVIGVSLLPFSNLPLLALFAVVLTPIWGGPVSTEHFLRFRLLAFGATLVAVLVYAGTFGLHGFILSKNTWISVFSTKF